MKTALNIIVWAVLMGASLAHATTTPVLTAEVHSGLRRILNLAQGDAGTPLVTDSQIQAEAGHLNQLIRDCRGQFGVEACVSSIDEQIRSFHQELTEANGFQASQHDLALTILHNLRSTAYGVERYGVERHGVER